MQFYFIKTHRSGFRAGFQCGKSFIIWFESIILNPPIILLTPVHILSTKINHQKQITKQIVKGH